MHTALQYVVDVIKERYHPNAPEFWMLVSPIAAYWILATLYDLVDQVQSPWLNTLRIQRKGSTMTNTITKGQVVRRVVLQHIIQAVFTICLTLAEPQACDVRGTGHGLAGTVSGWILAMFIMDTWQYCIHRLAHEWTFLYKNVHSTHHQLWVPYAYGALYNHPLEALLLDTLGGLATFLFSGLSCQTLSCFFAFASMKTVFDHSGYRFPINPVANLFPNNAAFHDVHHDARFIKKNYSQPFFTHLDYVLGTWLDPAEFHLTKAEIKEIEKQKTSKKKN